MFVDDLVMAKAVLAKDTPWIPAFLEHTAKPEEQVFQTLDPQSKCVICNDSLQNTLET